jgi:AmmeMemoRadiSam system protein B
VRRPAVAGRFYPGKPAEVSKAIDELLGEKVPREKWTAAMVPHAGWKFSGQLAADVLKRIEYPANVIIIGPKHTAIGVEWAVAPQLVWGLPNGNLGSNERLAKALASGIPGLRLDSKAHEQEHGIEVELPFIQRLAPKTRVVGVTIGSATKQRCEEFAEGLANVVSAEQEPPLLIISSDMNHYASDAETRRLDELALERLDRLDTDGLYDVCTAEHISMCGMRPAVMIIKALQKLGRVSTCQRVGYATSADVTGDSTRVVGYAGMLFR